MLVKWARVVTREYSGLIKLVIHNDVNIDTRVTRLCPFWMSTSTTHVTYLRITMQYGTLVDSFPVDWWVTHFLWHVCFSYIIMRYVFANEQVSSILYELSTFWRQKSWVRGGVTNHASWPQIMINFNSTTTIQFGVIGPCNLDRTWSTIIPLLIVITSQW